MTGVNLKALEEQLELADLLLSGRDRLLEPQDLPRRYSRAIRALDHLLQATQIEAVLGGGWAVWRYGFIGRGTQDVEIVLPADRLDEFLRAALLSGFELLPRPQGLWPQLLHKDTGIEVDILPEGGRPGSAVKPAPTTIPPPGAMGAAGTALRYINLPSLIELKIAAGRARDESDVVELIRVNADQVFVVRQHLSSVHADYVGIFDELVQRAREQHDH